MFEITGDNFTDIYLTRGDTAILHVTLRDSNGEYKLGHGDSLVLSAKRNIDDDSYVFQFRADSNCDFNISHSDTAKLPYGSYKYDIQLSTENGGVYTVIPVSDFTIGEEITV